MLKIANVIMEGRYGGPQARIASVAERLQNQGIETIVVFSKHNSNLFHKKLTEKGINARPLRLHRLTKEKFHLIMYISLFLPELFSLYKVLKKERVDIVHCNGSWQIKGVIAGKLTGAKVVWHLNDTSIPFFISIIFKFLGIYFCEAFIAAGKRVRTYYLSDRRFAKKQVIEIQAPVDTSIFNPNKVSTDKIIADYPGLKIVLVSNINPLKGVEYFVEMASILNKRYSNLSFLVVGANFASQGKYSKIIYRLVDKLRLNNFYFYGSSDDIPAVLKAADIFVCSSIAEASPIAVWEAMSMAKPIVSSDVGDVERFITKGENGFVVSVEDAIALAEKVEEFIKSRTLREKFGRNAREVAVKFLDIDICAKQHAQIYRAITNRH